MRRAPPGRRAPRGEARGGRPQGRDLRPGRGPAGRARSRPPGHHAGRHPRHRPRSRVARSERAVLSGRAPPGPVRVGRRVSGPVHGPLPGGGGAVPPSRGRAGALPPQGDSAAGGNARPRVSGDPLAAWSRVVGRHGGGNRSRRRRGRGSRVCRRDAARRHRPCGRAGPPGLRPEDGARRGGHRHARALRIFGRFQRPEPLRPPRPDAHAPRSAGTARDPGAPLARSGRHRIALGRGRGARTPPRDRRSASGRPRRRRRSRAAIRPRRRGHCRTP